MRKPVNLRIEKATVLRDGMRCVTGAWRVFEIGGGELGTFATETQAFRVKEAFELLGDIVATDDIGAAQLRDMNILPADYKSPLTERARELIKVVDNG